MGTWNGKEILKLTALEAKKRGYLTAIEYTSHVEWIRGNFAERSNKRFIYVNSEYKGMAESNEPLYKIINRLNINGHE